MNQLKFEKTKSPCHKIMTDSNGKRYIMDMGTLTPNIYGFGFLPKQVSVDMVEFGHHDKNFEFKAKPSPKYTWVVAATQPLTTILYRMFKNIFLKYAIHEQILLKWGLVGLSIVIAYVLAKGYIKRAQKKVAERLPASAKKYRAIFTYGNRRDFSNWYVVAFISIFVSFFMFSSFGGEGIFLIIITILSSIFFIMWLGMSPIHYDYEKQYISLVSIEEIQ